MTSTRARSATLVLVTIATLLAVAGLSWSLRAPAPALADSIPVTVPDVGAAPDAIFELADSIPVTVPDVGAAPGTGVGGSVIAWAGAAPRAGTGPGPPGRADRTGARYASPADRRSNAGPRRLRRGLNEP